MPDIEQANYVASEPLTTSLSKIADEIRDKTGEVGEIHPDEMSGKIHPMVVLPSLNNPAIASDILDGKEAIDGNGDVLTGTLEVPYNAMELVTVSMNNWLQGKSGFASNKLYFDLPKIAKIEYFFQSATFLPDTEITMNIPSANSLLCFLQWSHNVKKVTLINYNPSKVVNYQHAFSCEGIKEIDCEFDFSAITIGNRLDDTFRSTTLVELRIAPNTLSVIGQGTFSYPPKLSDESIISIANCLKDGVTGQKLTLHATPKARTLEIMGNVSQRTKIINEGTETEETITYNFFTQDDNGEMSLNAFITTVKGWTLA